MGKLKEKKYYIAFILVLCIFFGAIVTFHSYYNLQAIIQPASQKWGRSTSLGEGDLYKKQPSIIVGDQYTEVLTANKSNLTLFRIDRGTRETSEENIDIKGVPSYKIQKIEWDPNHIYFIESNSLYYVEKNPSGGYSAKTKLCDDAKDFQLVRTKEGAILAAVQSDGILVFKQKGNSFSQYGDKYPMDKTTRVAALMDSKGILHIAAYAEVNAIYFPIHYVTMENGTWHLIGSVTEKCISSSWSITDIDIGIDDTDAYIFYEMTKWDKGGVDAKTFMAMMPLYQTESKMQFTPLLVMDSDRNDTMLFMNEVNTIKEQKENLQLSVVRNSRNKKLGAGFTAYQVTMDNGKTVGCERITLNQRLLSNSEFVSHKGDNIFVYLDAAGDFNYEAFYTEDSSRYYQNSIMASKEDYKIAAMNTIPGYVSTFIVSFIKLTLYFPIILWFLLAEFAVFRKLNDKPKLVMGVGLLLYMIVKLLTFGNYYTDVSIAQMPWVLTFQGAQYIYAVGIAVISYLTAKLLQRNNPDISTITVFIAFALIDIEFTNLLFATYMV
jgi:hypothetical protein